MRWYRGQQLWDERYKSSAARAARKRARLMGKADTLVKNAFEQGLVHDLYSEVTPTRITTEYKSNGRVHRKSSLGAIQPERRWGPLDLQDEKPPPSAIAGRRDTVSQPSTILFTVY